MCTLASRIQKGVSNTLGKLVAGLLNVTHFPFPNREERKVTDAQFFLEQLCPLSNDRAVTAGFHFPSTAPGCCLQGPEREGAGDMLQITQRYLSHTVPSSNLGLRTPSTSQGEKRVAYTWFLHVCSY